MIKPMQATSDGDAYESNESEGIWTAGINLPFRPESIFSRSKDSVWHSRIECHGESKEDAEELRDAVLTAVSNPERLQDVTLAERERCAQICEEIAREKTPLAAALGADDCATAIRQSAS